MHLNIIQSVTLNVTHFPFPRGDQTANVVRPAINGRCTMYSDVNPAARDGDRAQQP